MTMINASDSRDVGFARTNGSSSTSIRDAGKDLRQRLLQVAAVIVAALIAVWLIGIFAQANVKPFTIERGGNLISHVGFTGAMDAGEQTGRPVLLHYLGTGDTLLSTYKLARAHERDTNVVGVIVRVYPGDRFEKRWWHWHYVPAPHPISNGRLV
ncbi:MAG: hypothetical protein JWO84_160 [Parcubacteria group bacterium]|nr:hypothetical protein [Parcubacteria group bacterium]